jgi:protein-L-isoaspartate(D-aspartate) O-methyltransferase
MAPTPSPAEWATRRQQMMANQLRPFDVTDLAVLAAFDSIPRETFIAPAAAAMAYLDREAPSAGDSKRLLLAPAVLARLLQAAKIQPGEKALEIAGGSGYSAAIMAALGARVSSLDLDTKAMEAGPFDVILVNGAFERSPEEYLRALADAGRLIGIDASTGAPKAVLVEKMSDSFSRRVLFDANGPRLEEFLRIPEFTF